MNSRTTWEFKKLFAALPAAVRRQGHIAFRLFLQNPAHPGLHFKRVLDDPPIFSARVGLGYRALAFVEGNTAAWFWIGTHAEYDKLLKRL